MTYEAKMDYYKKGVIFRWNAVNPYTRVIVTSNRQDSNEIIEVSVVYFYKGYERTISVVWSLEKADTYADLNFAEIRTVEMLGNEFIKDVMEGAKENG